MNVGRSVSEQLRLITALQTAERTGAYTPEGWLEDMPLLESAPTTLDEALQAGRDDAPWYFRQRGKPQ
jgi:peroxiredoxin (alkyl hydroperoxide reductase subunit C)